MNRTASIPDLVRGIPQTVAWMDDVDLAWLNFYAQAEWDPRSEDWYLRLAHLFTEDDSTRMHVSVKAALDREVRRRLDPSLAVSR